MANNRDYIVERVVKNKGEKSTYICAEIGVWQGGFSERILKDINPSELHLVDPWVWSQGKLPKNFFIANTRIAKKQEDMNNIHSNVCKRFANDKRVEVHRTFSVDAALILCDEYFDFVYIDGAHNYENVVKDLEAWFPKVKKGGMLTGDDYNWFHGGQHPVKKAVEEFAKKHSGSIARDKTQGGQFIFYKN